MSFLPSGFEIPTTSNYMKFEEGDNTFRILGSFVDGTAIMGTEFWVTVDSKRKPRRLPMGQPVPVAEIEVNPETNEVDLPKHFWAMPVWNYKDKKVQILEITQKTIQQAIKSLSENPKWGQPQEYDLVVTRIKENGKTSYTVTPDPKEPISDEIAKAYTDITINIKALFKGDDPFTVNETIDEEDLPVKLKSTVTEQDG